MGLDAPEHGIGVCATQEGRSEPACFCSNRRADLIPAASLQFQTDHLPEVRRACPRPGRISGGKCDCLRPRCGRDRAFRAPRGKIYAILTVGLCFVSCWEDLFAVDKAETIRVYQELVN